MMPHRRLLPPRWAATLSHSISNGNFLVTGDLTKLAAGAIPAVGVEAQVTHSFSLEDTRAFAQISGDNNPLHVDVDFARKNASKGKPVVHGLLSASLFATIFGRTVPGAVYVKQDLRWKTPLFVNEQVTARIRVIKVCRRFIECETVCTHTSDGVVVVDGYATILMPSSANQDLASR